MRRWTKGIAALESGAMDDQALSALNAALQEAQVSLASSEESVELLGSILGSLMGEGGALQNALDGVADATGEMGASLLQISQAVQSMLLRSLAEPLEELRKTWIVPSKPRRKRARPSTRSPQAWGWKAVGNFPRWKRPPGMPARRTCARRRCACSRSRKT